MIPSLSDTVASGVESVEAFVGSSARRSEGPSVQRYGMTQTSLRRSESGRLCPFPETHKSSPALEATRTAFLEKRT